MLTVTNAKCHIKTPYAECHYAECDYAECDYAECRGPMVLVPIMLKKFYNIFVCSQLFL